MARQLFRFSRGYGFSTDHRADQSIGPPSRRTSGTLLGWNARVLARRASKTPSVESSLLEQPSPRESRREHRCPSGPGRRSAAGEDVFPIAWHLQVHGGAVAEQPARYAATSAMALLPIGVPQTIVEGGLLKDGNDLVSSYEAAANSKRDSVTVLKLEGSGHFDMLAPGSQYGKSLIETILALLK